MTTEVGCVRVFMPFSDRSRRIMRGVRTVMQVLAFLAFLVLPFTVPVVPANVLISGAGGALAGAFYKVGSHEVFPTVRGDRDRARRGSGP